jgi:hypothetical protein
MFPGLSDTHVPREATPGIGLGIERRKETILLHVTELLCLRHGRWLFPGSVPSIFA